MKTYNKLVRDKIPEIINKENKTCEVRVLNDNEYLQKLNEKLQEELNEYLQSGEIEELADLQEVMLAILNVKQVSLSQFEKIRQNKVAERGAFKNKILLISKC